MIKSIFAHADGIIDIVEDYDMENIDFFVRLPDAVLQKMATVLSEAHKHLDNHLSIYQGELNKI